MRALPSWDELTRLQYALFPNHPLRKDVETSIRDEMKELLKARIAAEEAVAEERRQRRDLQQDIYRQLLAARGVELAPNDAVIDASDAPDQADEAAESPSDTEENLPY